MRSRCAFAGLAARLVVLVVAVSLWTASAEAQYALGPVFQVTHDPPAEMQPVIAVHESKMVCAWYGGYDYGAGWASSLDGGETWSEGSRSFPSLSTYEVIAGPNSVSADADGNFYLVARTVHGLIGWTVAVFRGTFTGSSLNWERRTNAIPFIGFEALGPDYPQLLCDPVGGLVLIYTEVHDVEQTVKFVRSLDGGQSWSAPMALSGSRCNGARAVLGPDGELYVLWFDFSTLQVMGRKSLDHGVTFEPAFVVSEVEFNFQDPVLWRNRSGREAPIHEKVGLVGAPGLLAVAVDESQGPHRGRLYVTWGEQATGTAAPMGGGVSEVEPNNTRQQATPVNVGQTLAGFMYGAEPSTSDYDWFRFEGTVGTTLRITGRACGWGGLFPIDSWGFALRCGSDSLAMPIVPALVHCRDNYPAVVYTLPATGTYYLDMGGTGGNNMDLDYSLTLGKLEVGAGSVARDHRDIVISWSDDQGATWTSGRRVNDDQPFYDNALPAVAVDSRGRVHVAWYDRRDDPECSAGVHTYWSYSENGGESFMPSMRLSESLVDLMKVWRHGDPPPWAVGDFMALEAIGDRVHVFWAQPAPRATGGFERGEIFGTIIRPDTTTTSTLVRAFDARVVEDRVVLLSWSVASEARILGFRLHRADGEQADFIPLTSEPIPTRERTDFELRDTSVSPGQSYRYRLEVVLEDGSLWHGPVSVRVPLAKLQVRWRGARPNPFREMVTLSLECSRATSGSVAIYDVTGHEVRRLRAGSLGAGLTAFHWDGRDGRGRVVRAGVYLVRARVEGSAATSRVARIP